MALTNVWMINEYDIEDFEINVNDTVIDIGAHIGLFSLLVSQLCKTGKILSFEPVRENFDLLVSNLKLTRSIFSIWIFLVDFGILAFFERDFVRILIV